MGTSPGAQIGPLSRTKLAVTQIPEGTGRERVLSMFASAGAVVDCRLIAARGLAFVEFATAEEAERARTAFDGAQLQGRALRVSFAQIRNEPKPECNLYIGNLPPDATLDFLTSAFAICGPVASSRVDRGIGFVAYHERAHAEAAIARFHGRPLHPCSAPLLVKFANRCRGQQTPQMQQQPPPYNGFAPQPPSPGKALPFINKGQQRYNPLGFGPMPVPEPPRTPVYVYNIGDDIDELALWQLFGPYGAIDSIKVMKDQETKKNRGFAFVNMKDYEEASQAIRALNGFAVNGQVLSVSFKTQKK